jgi:hypothetical protein
MCGRFSGERWFGGRLGRSSLVRCGMFPRKAPSVWLSTESCHTRYEYIVVQVVSVYLLQLILLSENSEIQS